MFVRALIELIPDQQGRARTRRPLYRPNHNFGTPKHRDFFIGQIEIPQGEELRSGQSRELLINFFDSPELRAELRVGREWRLQEGLTLVGHARVVEIPD